VLFDMDGVIVDTEQAVTAFWQKLAAAHGVHISDGDFAVHVYGRPAGDTLASLFPHLTEEERDRAIAEMCTAEMSDTYVEVPGAIDLVRALHRQSIPTALVTSGEPWKVSAVTQQLGIEPCFTATVTASDIQAGKPDPQSYLLAAERLGQPIEECIVFEDAVSGVQAAVASGATCVGMARARREEPLLTAGACWVIADFARAKVMNSPPRQSHGHILLFPSGTGESIRLEIA
jgi:sugar-phosphatase